MDGFALESLFNGATMDLPKLEELFLRMALATLLGAAVAYRFWRRFLPRLTPPSVQGAQSQTLIAAAGAVMVVVIGDHPARAFGLVGLGSFIRFRSGISDPRDAAVMFVMIGIGMACGLGLSSMAIGATVFVCLILLVFDLSSPRTTKRTRVTMIADDPALVRSAIAKIFPRLRVLEISKSTADLGKDSGKLVLELDLNSAMDAAAIRELLDAHGVPGVRRVAFAADD